MQDADTQTHLFTGLVCLSTTPGLDVGKEERSAHQRSSHRHPCRHPDRTCQGWPSSQIPLHSHDPQSSRIPTSSDYYVLTLISGSSRSSPRPQSVESLFFCRFVTRSAPTPRHCSPRRLSSKNPHPHPSATGTRYWLEVRASSTTVMPSSVESTQS